MDSNAPDYKESVFSVAEKLAYLEGVSFERIITRFLEVRDDTLRLRITTPLNLDFLPLAFATDAVEATQRLVLAGATSALRPQIHHQRLGRLAEASQLLRTAKFQHTEQSSFVFKVSCAYDALDVPELDNVPFVRSTMLTIMRGLRELVTAIEADRLDNLVEAAINAQVPALSSNLCEALTHFYDEGLGNALDVSVDWSPLNPAPEVDKSPVTIQQDYFPRIDEVQRALRNTAAVVEDLFVGTVEQLNGDMGPDGRRSGQVVLNLLLEDEVVRAQVSLDADQYAMADEIHMTDGAYAYVIGRLHPGRQPRSITNLRQFGRALPRDDDDDLVPA
jgi:hypothetical protein